MLLFRRTPIRAEAFNRCLSKTESRAEAWARRLGKRERWKKLSDIFSTDKSNMLTLKKKDRAEAVLIEAGRTVVPVLIQRLENNPSDASRLLDILVKISADPKCVVDKTLGISLWNMFVADVGDWGRSPAVIDLSLQWAEKQQVVDSLGKYIKDDDLELCALAAYGLAKASAVEHKQDIVGAMNRYDVHPRVVCERAEMAGTPLANEIVSEFRSTLGKAVSADGREEMVQLEELCAETLRTRHTMQGAWPDYDRIAQFQSEVRKIEFQIMRIGMAIEAAGGFELMKRVCNSLSDHASFIVDSCWDGIGRWRH